MKTPGRQLGKQELKYGGANWQPSSQLWENPDFYNSQDLLGSWGFPMDFETFVISFSYLIPKGGPGEIEAIAQQTLTGCPRPSSSAGQQPGESAPGVPCGNLME